MNEQESLAELLEAAPPELRTMLTRECPAGNHGMYQSLRAKDTPPRTCKICGLVGYGFSRTVLPVPEATLAAMQWVPERGWYFIGPSHTARKVWLICDPETYTTVGKGADIFAAIRAALGGG